ncbi:MAG: hypothetical protein ACRDV3_10295 [Acidothermaceae bacterium]
MRWLAGLALAGVVVAALPSNARAATAARPSSDVIVVGSPQLTWSDVSATRTPNLWQLAAGSALGSLSVKAAQPVSCLDDGWLTLGAGDRADASDRHSNHCGSSALTVQGEGTSATIVGFAAAYRYNVHRADETHLGALADALNSRGDCISAAGAPAALGAADATGNVHNYRADAAQAVTDRAFLARCAVTFVSATPADIDTTVSTVSRNAPSGAVVIVVGLSDASDSAAHLHVAIAHGGGFGTGQLVSASTRRTPFVQLVDLAPTVLSLRGVAEPTSMIGQPWQRSASRAATLSGEVTKLARLDRAARQQAGAVLPFWVTLVALMLAACGFAAWVAWRRREGASSRVAALACAWCASLPAAGFLSGAVPWWGSAEPLAALALATVISATLITLIAVVLDAVVWRRHAFGLAAAVGTITFLVIVVDLVTGAQLQIFTMPGYSPLVAGRFAGIGNVGFGVFGAGAVLAAAGLCAAVRAHGRFSDVDARARWGALSAVVVGVLAVVVDGAPSLGSDVGGVLALVPSFAVLFWLLAGVRISSRRMLVGALATAAIITAFALIDYARPSSDQTHLGRFVGDVVHGGAWGIVRRKALADLHLLGYSVLTLLIPFMVAVAIWLLWRPPRSLRLAFSAPVLRPALVALLVLTIVGAVLNDSGVVIPALALLVVLPATMAVVVSTRPAVTPREADESDRPSPGLLR